MANVGGVDELFAIILTNEPADQHNIRFVCTKKDIWASYQAGYDPVVDYTTSGELIPDNSSNWYHIAVVRNGTSFKTYINGVERGSATSSRSFPVPTGFTIGNHDGNDAWRYGADSYVGNLEEFRISKGIARWTSNFSVPVASYTP
jgi:hypothetical protein